MSLAAALCLGLCAHQLHVEAHHVAGRVEIFVSDPKGDNKHSHRIRALTQPDEPRMTPPEGILLSGKGEMKIDGPIPPQPPSSSIPWGVDFGAGQRAFEAKPPKVYQVNYVEIDGKLVKVKYR